MSPFFRLLGTLFTHKKLLIPAVVLQILVGFFTLISIPVIIPLIQILFGMSPSTFEPPQNWYDIEDSLNYFFSRIIAFTDRKIALGIICIAVLILYGMRNLCRYLASYFLIPAKHRVIKDLRNEIFQSFTNLDYRSRQKFQKGDLLSLISNDIQTIEHGLLVSVESLFKIPVIILGCLVLMFWIHVPLTLFSLLLLAIVVFVIGRLSNKLKQQSHALQDQLAQVVTASDELLSATKTVISYNASSFFLKRFNRLNQSLMSLSNRMIRRRDLASPLSEFLGIAVVACFLYYGGQLVFSGELLSTTFMTFLFAFYHIIDPAKNFSREYYNVQKADGALNRVHSMIHSSYDKDKIKDDQTAARFEDSIALRDVSVSLPDHNRPIVDQINLKINKGEKVAFVGPSGGGKSTILNLILGLINPSQGYVFMDGVKIEQYNQVQYRTLFGLVSQEAEMFHLSIIDNILLGRESGRDSDLKQIYQTTLVDEIIENKTSKEQNPIGDAGMRLSGGEKQRLSLVRALITQPEIVILDEPTSSLDQESSKKVTDAILKSIESKTAIIATHNLSLLESVDRIYVIKQGMIAEHGTLAELMNIKGHLYSIIEHKRWNS